MRAAAHVHVAVLAVAAAASLASTLAPPVLSRNGTRVLIANGTAPLAVGLYAMVWACDLEHDQFGPLTEADLVEMLHNEYIAGISLHFRWKDIQPLPPPASLDLSCLTRRLDQIDAACATAGLEPHCLPVFVKPYLAHEPDWVSAEFANKTQPGRIATNSLGMKVLVIPSAWKNPADPGPAVANVTLPISTDAAWRTQVTKLAAGVSDWLEEVDPLAERVPMVHFFPPAMTSVQMRPGPSQIMPFLSNSGPDVLGMQWTKAGHLAAWQRAAESMAGHAAFAKRVWAFDFTVLPPRKNNRSYIALETAYQAEAFDALAAAHPQGPGAVVAKTESLHVDIDPKTDHTCAFVPDPHSPSSFGSQYATNPDIPYKFIGDRRFRHGWENFAPLCAKSLPANKSQIPSMYPVSDLAVFSTMADIGVAGHEPVVPQAAVWAEVWKAEAVNTSSLPCCARPHDLAAALLAWHGRIRAELQRALAVL